MATALRVTHQRKTSKSAPKKPDPLAESIAARRIHRRLAGPKPELSNLGQLQEDKLPLYDASGRLEVAPPPHQARRIQRYLQWLKRAIWAKRSHHRPPPV